MRIVLFAHGGSGNHGCEALVRGTVKIARRENISKFLVATCAQNEDVKYGIDGVEFAEYALLKKNDPVKYIDKIARTIFKSGYFRKKVIKPIIEKIDKDDIWLSIGGDNYSYAGVIPYDIIGVHNAVVERNVKCILWGCSIDRDNLVPAIIEDLKKYDYIIARESITFNWLLEAGIQKEKIGLYPDSAFTLEKDPNHKKIDDRFKYVGINMSPVIMDTENGKTLIYNNYRKLIEYILKETNYHILLIPHVVWGNSDDRKAMMRLYDVFKNSGKIDLVEDQNACKLKDIISKCELFVGARTHSTIAAYSSCVPTLVVGYSVKSKGIAKDIFGCYENYVIGNNELIEEDNLQKAFIWLEENKKEIQIHLNNFMPEYIKRAYEAGNVIRRIGEQQ